MSRFVLLVLVLLAVWLGRLLVFAGFMFVCLGCVRMRLFVALV